MSSHTRAAKRQHTRKMNDFMVEQYYQEAKKRYPELAKTYSRGSLVRYFWNELYPNDKVK